MKGLEMLDWMQLHFSVSKKARVNFLIVVGHGLNLMEKYQKQNIEHMDFSRPNICCILENLAINSADKFLNEQQILGLNFWGLHL